MQGGKMNVSRGREGGRGEEMEGNQSILRTRLGFQARLMR